LGGSRRDGRDAKLSEKRYYLLGRRNEGGQQEPDIPLRAQLASRRQAVVFFNEQGQTFIMDIGSAHGTFLDDRKLEKHRWRKWFPDQVVRFGLKQWDNQAQPSYFEEVHLEQRERLAPPQVMPQPRPRSSAEAFEEETSDQRFKRARISGPATAEDAPRIAYGPEPPPQRSVITPARPAAEAPAAHSGGQRAVITPARPAANGSLRAPAFLSKAYGPQRPETSVRTHCVEASASSRKTAEKCDKCDGPHATDDCPHFRKAREEHKDAWVNYGQKNPLSMGGDGGNKLLPKEWARVVPQPGDGSCLFHSLCHGLCLGRGAEDLRRKIAKFIECNSQLEIAGDTLEEWIRWDQNTSSVAYARRMAHSGWGGGIEMAAFSHLHKVNVHVYEHQRTGQFRRISCFNYPTAGRTVHVLYRGRMHFDALQPLRGY
jgi:hypothetical protein